MAHRYPVNLKTSNPKTVDGADTRTAILDAAELVFAREGLRAARTETIAERVGVTKAMIHYYFGTKEKLYEAVLQRIDHDRAQGIGFESLRALPPGAALRQYVARLLEQMTAKPHTAPLFALENIQNGGQYYGRPGASVSALVEILENGVNQGCFRRVDPRHTAVIIMGACLHFFNVMQNVRLLWPKRMDEKTLLREHTDAVLDFVFAGLSDKTGQASEES